MFKFWDLVIAPLLRALAARRIIEIGVDAGVCTRRLLDYCVEVDGHLDYIDPKPAVDLRAMFGAFDHVGTWHATTSLDALSAIATPDVALIDGDHNWYTVYHELEALHARAEATHAPFPLVLFHDVSWPYGRRDLYYSASRIPVEFQQPYARKGMVPGVVALVDEGGLNNHLDNAVNEGGPRNGVRTAIEDFLAAHDVGTLIVLNAWFGLAILVPKHLQANAAVMREIDQWRAAAGLERLVDFVERERGIEMARSQPVIRAMHAELERYRVAERARVRPRLSVVVVVHDMQREAPRTLLSLSPQYQRDIDADDYEVIVVENGGSRPLSPSAIAALGPSFQYHFLAGAGPSPAPAVNYGLAHASGDVVGVMIDGARIATPGLLSQVAKIARLGDNAVIATLGFYLGECFQRRAIQLGYNKEDEDALLERIAWPQDGYRLFEVGCLDESSHFSRPISESNALFLHREAWAALGGMDERFDAPGGGLVNLDTFARACALPGSELVVLLGEGTFHQVHGGVATNAPMEVFSPRKAEWLAQYARLRGAPWREPTKPRRYFGTLPQACFAQMAAEHAATERPSEVARQLEEAERDAAVLRTIVGELRNERDGLSATLHGLQASRSWRLTEPLRSLRRFTARLPMGL